MEIADRLSVRSVRPKFTAFVNFGAFVLFLAALVAPLCTQREPRTANAAREPASVGAPEPLPTGK